MKSLCDKPKQETSLHLKHWWSCTSSLPSRWHWVPSVLPKRPKMQPKKRLSKFGKPSQIFARRLVFGPGCTGLWWICVITASPGCGRIFTHWRRNSFRGTWSIRINKALRILTWKRSSCLISFTARLIVSRKSTESCYYSVFVRVAVMLKLLKYLIFPWGQLKQGSFAPVSSSVQRLLTIIRKGYGHEI